MMDIYAGSVIGRKGEEFRHSPIFVITDSEESAEQAAEYVFVIEFPEFEYDELDTRILKVQTENQEVQLAIIETLDEKMRNELINVTKKMYKVIKGLD